MKATLILRERTTRKGVIVEMVIWQLPQPASLERSHGLKYRLFAGRDEECLVRYDNESGKGDHVHYGDH